MHNGYKRNTFIQLLAIIEMRKVFYWTYLLLIFGCNSTDRNNNPKKEISTIAFGSCAKQWEKQPIWKEIEKDMPDLFLFIGDAIYGDWDGVNVYEVSAESLDRDYDKLNAIPEFKEFREKTPILATWDNHDYGKHNGGSEFNKKELTKQHFLNFFNEPMSSERYQTPGIYDSKIYGEVGRQIQIILLDTRWFKSPFKIDSLSTEARKEIGKVGKYTANFDSTATLLGKKQLSWLENELKKDADVRLICSSIQVIPNQKGMDEWGNYPLERTQLLEMISNCSGYPIILSGNVHFAEISKLKVGNRHIYELTSSGLTHVNEKYAKAPNKYRIQAPFIDLNYGLINVNWEDREISLTIKGMNKSEKPLYISFD